MDYEEASSDSERVEKKKGKKSQKHAEGLRDRDSKRNGRGQDRQRAKGKGRKGANDDQSSEEEKTAREVLEEQKKSAKAQHFQALEDSEGDSASQEVEPEAETGEQETAAYLRPLLQDIRLFGNRLTTLEPLMEHPDLSEEGERFLRVYWGMLKGYLCNLSLGVMFAARGERAHPVFRVIAKSRDKVKALDRLWRTHRAEVEGWTPAEETGPQEGEEEEDMGEDGLEVMGDELGEGFEDELGGEEEEVDAHKPRSKRPQAAGKQANGTESRKPIKTQNMKREGFVKKRVQTFKLDAPKSFADTFHYNPEDGDDEDDRVLNLGKRKPLKPLSDPSDEITLADLKAMEVYDAMEAKLMKQAKVAKPSVKGKLLYEELAQEKSKTQSLSNALNREVKAELDKHEKKVMFNERRIGADEPRTLTQTMLLNQGLKRKRENKISRVKLREKYEKAKRLDATRKGVSSAHVNQDMLTGTGEAINREIKLS